MDGSRRKRSTGRAVRTAGLAALLTVVLLLAGTAAVDAQSGGGYDLSWWTVDGGAGTLSGGGLTLSGSAGQPEPGPALSGGSYTLLSGFWPGGASEYRIYLPLIVKTGA